MGKEDEYDLFGDIDAFLKGDKSFPTPEEVVFEEETEEQKLIRKVVVKNMAHNIWQHIPQDDPRKEAERFHSKFKDIKIGLEKFFSNPQRGDNQKDIKIKTVRDLTLESFAKTSGEIEEEYGRAVGKSEPGTEEYKTNESWAQYWNRVSMISQEATELDY